MLLLRGGFEAARLAFEMMKAEGLADKVTAQRDVGLQRPFSIWSHDRTNQFEAARLAFQKAEAKGFSDKITADLQPCGSRFFNSEETIIVTQREFATTAKANKKNVLLTFGVEPCIGLVLHDTQNQIAFMAHVDSRTTNVSNAMREFLSHCDIENTAAHIISTEADPIIIDNYAKIITALGVKDISINRASTIALDTSSGSVYSNISAGANFEITEELTNRVINLDINGDREIKQIHDGFLEEYKSPGQSC